MEVKVGQWVRLMSNRFMKNEQEDYEDVVAVGFGDPIIKVANTPQELVRVGDLIKDEYGVCWEVETCNEGADWIKHYNEEVTELSKVKAVYTLNSNGNYIKRWEKGDE